MGTITLEFYLIHGVFVELFGYSFIDIAPSLYYIRNVALMILVVAIPSIPAALFVKKLDKYAVDLLTGNKEAKAKKIEA